MRRRFIGAIVALATVCCSIPTTVQAAKRGWSSRDLPAQLTTNAYAVVRQDSTVFTCKGVLSATKSCTEVYTILNKQGDDFAIFTCHTNANSALKRFRCTVYDADGELQRTLSRNELRSTELGENMADDYTTHYLATGFPTYPYTVAFEYEIEYTNGFLSLPIFLPAHYVGASVERSSLTMITPADYHYTWQSINGELTPTEQRIKGSLHRKWAVSGLKAYRYDSYMPTYEQMMPQVLLAPSAFIYHKTSGDGSSWERYGRWQWQLMEGRDALPQELAATVHALTDTIPTRRGKIERLYRYLGETTRYVSIQLGLGGLQPMRAEEVWRSHFGDCKALSNYMKGMLREIGIESHYVEISTNSRRIARETAAAAQTNHVILKVPDPEGDLWLECTNTQMPLGFLHSDIAGHDAVVYADGTAHIETLPERTAEQNRLLSQVVVTPHGGQGATFRVSEHYIGSFHEPLMNFAKRLKQDKRIDFVRSRLSVSTATIDSLTVVEQWSAEPQLRLDYTATAPTYGTRSNNRLFLALTPLAVNTAKLNRTRETDIWLSGAYQQQQTIELMLPEGYTIERLPAPVSVESDFGHFSMQLTPLDDRVRITIESSSPSGLFDRSRIEELRAYLAAIDRAFKQRIVLIAPTA